MPNYMKNHLGKLNFTYFLLQHHIASALGFEVVAPSVLATGCGSCAPLPQTWVMWCFRLSFPSEPVISIWCQVCAKVLMHYTITFPAVSSNNFCRFLDLLEVNSINGKTYLILSNIVQQSEYFSACLHTQCK